GELNRYAAALRPSFGWGAHAIERDVPRLRDACDDARRPGAQAGTVLTVAEFGDHVLAAGFPGEPVRDPFLESVADLDPNLPFFEREQNQQAVFLLLVADPTAVVLEQLVGVLTNVAVRLDGLNGGDDDDVARRVVELADHPIHRGGVRRVDDVSEVVDRFREL